MVAFRSVTLPTHPARAEFTRGETLCSGFCIWPESQDTSKVGDAVAVLPRPLGEAPPSPVALLTSPCALQVAYYNQAMPGYLTYVTTNVAGLSSDICSTFEACEKFLLKNKEDLISRLQDF